MKYYQASIPIQTTPKDGYIEAQQDAINSWWENTNTVNVIQEETEFGSGSWQNVDVQLFSVSQSKTGTKFPDDYRQLQFKSLSHVHDVGYKYLISDVTWLSIVDKSVIRKCNNTLKWIHNATLYTEPCIVDDVFSSVRVNEDQEIDLQQGQILIKTQYNSRTSVIKVNHRFILNGEAYRVIDSSSLGNSKVYNLILEFTETRDDDDLINSIADTSKDGYNEINHSLNGNVLSPLVDGITVGETQEFTIFNYNDGVATADTFNIELYDVPATNYELVSVDGNHFTIKNVSPYTANQLRVVYTNNTGSTTVTHYLTLKGWW